MVERKALQFRISLLCVVSIALEFCVTNYSRMRLANHMVEFIRTPLCIFTRMRTHLFMHYTCNMARCMCVFACDGSWSEYLYVYTISTLQSISAICCTNVYYQVFNHYLIYSGNTKIICCTFAITTKKQ